MGSFFAQNRNQEVCEKDVGKLLLKMQFRGHMGQTQLIQVLVQVVKGRA
jgi:hypothetical protein